MTSLDIIFLLRGGSQKHSIHLLLAGQTGAASTGEPRSKQQQVTRTKGTD